MYVRNNIILIVDRVGWRPRNLDLVWVFYVQAFGSDTRKVTQLRYVSSIVYPSTDLWRICEDRRPYDKVRTFSRTSLPSREKFLRITSCTVPLRTRNIQRKPVWKVWYETTARRSCYRDGALRGIFLICRQVTHCVIYGTPLILEHIQVPQARFNIIDAPPEILIAQITCWETNLLRSASI